MTELENLHVFVSTIITYGDAVARTGRFTEGCECALAPSLGCAEAS